MAPSVVAVGASTSSLSAITPAFPAGITAGDVLVTVAECEGVTAPGAYTLPAGWAHITGSPVTQGTNTRLWVIWALYDGVMTAPSLGDSGDHNIGQMIGLRGCPTTGNPWDVVATAVEAVSDTTASWPGVTTTVDDTLVLEIASTSADIGTAQISALTNGSYSSITERMDAATTSGNGGVIICYSGVKATKGATGQSTATLTTAGFKAFMTVAFKNAASSGGVANPQLLMRSPRPVEQHTVVGAYAPTNPSTLLGG
jgi:hypothetical protein